MRLASLRARLARAGLTLSATLPPKTYDALVPDVWRIASVRPGTRGVLIVGNAGRSLWPRFQASPEARLRRNSLDRYTERVLQEAASTLIPPAGVAIYTEKRDGVYLPMVRLAEFAGLGAPGRIGILIHPVFGPWISFRGLLYLPDAVGPERPRSFDPCGGCPAPCVEACPGHVITSDGLDPAACFRTKIRRRECRLACDARSACIHGREYSFGTSQIAHHSRFRWHPATVRHALRVLRAPGPTVSRRSRGLVGLERPSQG
ncbi:MAG: hypothetical protein ACE5FG_04080 [Myxococcota bacterium]